MEEDYNKKDYIFGPASNGLAKALRMRGELSSEEICRVKETVAS